MSNMGGNRRVLAPQTNIAKDTDEDLVLFRDIQKRDKEHNVSLLQPVSDDFESNNSGTHSFYRMSSGKKGFGLGVFTASDKNEYDWLKTPPATPLFASLEMDAGATNLVTQKEIPILQHLSRFSGNSDATKTSTTTATAIRPKTPTPKPKIPSRSVTPSTRRNGLVTNDIPNSKRTPISTQKTTMQTHFSNPHNSNNKRANTSTILTKSINNNPRENVIDSTPSKPTTNSSKPRSRGVSPLVRSTIPTTMPGFSDETPPNLRTDRPLSATRGRPLINPLITSSNQSKQDNTKPRRQSCSPSMARGRKQESDEGSVDSTTMSKMRAQGGNIFGSRMVDKVMNARKSSSDEKEAQKLKVGASPIDTSGFGRMMSKSSLDMALRHMEIKHDASKFHQANTAKNPLNMSTNSSKESSPWTTQLKGRTQESWKKRETRKTITSKEEKGSKFRLCKDKTIC